MGHLPRDGEQTSDGRAVTNIEVVQRFLDVGVDLQDDGGGCILRISAEAPFTRA
jgi:hypothetical protein